MRWEKLSKELHNISLEPQKQQRRTIYKKKWLARNICIVSCQLIITLRLITAGALWHSLQRNIELNSPDRTFWFQEQKRFHKCRHKQVWSTLNANTKTLLWAAERSWTLRFVKYTQHIQFLPWIHMWPRPLLRHPISLVFCSSGHSGPGRSYSECCWTVGGR